MARRPVQPMPDDIRAELEEGGLLELYEERPFYQRKDYLAWIVRAVKLETRRKRIEQMLAEGDRVAYTWAWIPYPAGEIEDLTCLADVYRPPTTAQDLPIQCGFTGACPVRRVC